MKRSTLSPGTGRKKRGGFSLVELLVVIAILVILTAGSITAFRSVNSALGLSTAAQLVTSEITTARQTALTYSKTVEVRFYLFTDAFTSANQYQAVQTFSSTDGTNFTQMDRVSYLPTSVMLTASPTLSYPLGESSTTFNPSYTPNTSTGAATLSAVGTSYTYKILRFKPGGGVDYIIPTSGSPSNLPSGTTWPPTSWYVTLIEKKYYSSVTSASYSAIKNFITVSVDSTDGRIRTFQP